MPNPHEGYYPNSSLQNAAVQIRGFSKQFSKEIVCFQQIPSPIFFCVRRFAHPPRSGCTIFNHFRTLLPREFNFFRVQRRHFGRILATIARYRSPLDGFTVFITPQPFSYVYFLGNSFFEGYKTRCFDRILAILPRTWTP